MPERCSVPADRRPLPGYGRDTLPLIGYPVGNDPVAIDEWRPTRTTTYAEVARKLLEENARSVPSEALQATRKPVASYLPWVSR